MLDLAQLQAFQQQQAEQAQQAAKVAMEQQRRQADQAQKQMMERAKQEEEAQLRNSRNQAMADTKQKMAQVQEKKCHLHKKPKKGCKFCDKHKDMVSEVQKEGKVSLDKLNKAGQPGKNSMQDADMDDDEKPLPLVNGKSFGFSGLLQTHVTECAHFKSLLSLETFEQLVDETYQYAKTAEPYMANSGTVPSALFACLYRFFTLGLSSSQLRKLMENQDSPYIRCLGFLYARFGLPHDQVLKWLSEYLLDDEEFATSEGGSERITMGGYVENLLATEKYYSAVLPRFPMATKRHIEEKIAPLSQNRKRMAANRSCIDSFRDRSVKVECMVNGEWVEATIIELDEHLAGRPKVMVRLADTNAEDYVHLGMVILRDGSSRKGSSRRSGEVDWTTEKGRSDKELVEEMRAKDRDKAVCSSGKDYARKPLGYKAACALPREQGQASYKLMEEETFISVKKRARTPSPDRQNFKQQKVSDEHKARMQQIFEKYGNQKSAGEAKSSGSGMDGSDVMRLG